MRTGRKAFLCTPSQSPGPQPAGGPSAPAMQLVGRQVAPDDRTGLLLPVKVGASENVEARETVRSSPLLERPRR